MDWNAILTPFQARKLMWKWWQLIWRQNNWKNSWFIGTFLAFSKNLYFSLCLFFDGTTRFSNKIWVPKRPHKSILAKGIQIIRKQRIFMIMFLDFFWSQKVPWVMFMASTNIAYQTNWVNIGIWAKMLVP